MDISIEDFKIIEKIGEGAFGAVYLAIFKPSGDRVAIKRVKKEACTIKVIERCRREARIMRKVHHPSIVNFYRSFETDTSFFIIMEYVAGRTLSEVIHSSSYNSSILETPNDNHFAGNYHTKGLAESMAMKYFIELACAIRYLHNYVKVVHRDIKLDNIIVDTNGHLKLLDFGFSNTEENSDSVLFNTACGTIGYTAPEIIKRECYDKKVDIWSIGVILYSMVTGNLPFFHENLQEACRLIVTGEPSYPPHLSSEMIELISKLLSKSPKTRPTIDQVFKISIVENEVQKYAKMVNFLTPTPIHPIDENLHFSSGQNLNQMSNSTTTTCQAPSQNATTSTAATTKTMPTHTNALDLNNSNNMNFNGFNNITLQNNLNFNSSNNLFVPTNNMTFNSSNNLSLRPNNHYNLNNNPDINFNSCNDLTHPYHQNNNYHFNRSNAIKFRSSDHSDGPNDNSSNYITCSKREVMFRIHNQAKFQEPNLVVASSYNSAQQITLSFTLKRPTNKRSSCTKNRYNIISTSPQNIIKPMIATSKESKELLSKTQHFLSLKPVNNK